MPNVSVEEDNLTPPHYREDGPPQVLTADTARQAPKGRRGLVILVASLLAIGVARVVIEMLSRHAA